MQDCCHAMARTISSDENSNQERRRRRERERARERGGEGHKRPGRPFWFVKQGKRPQDDMRRTYLMPKPAPRVKK